LYNTSAGARGLVKASLVIPCYNESGNIRRLVAMLDDDFSAADCEILLVENGSTDGTLDILLEETEDLDHVRVINVPVNKGYGYGIQQGLAAAKGDILAWTHADLQAAPKDLLEGIKLFHISEEPSRLFVKGQRYGRSFRDVLFTWGMTLFETLLLHQWMADINAQPTIFHRQFFQSWDNPPNDLTLDLYAFHLASKNKLSIRRFPVFFGQRSYGEGQNESFASKIRNSWKTMTYSVELRRRTGERGT
jgi:polyisoprenyl-phosphate glycosyltransferase